MALTNKQKSFNKLTDDILETCSGNTDNVVKFTIAAKAKPLRESIDDLEEQHAILLKRQALWEIVIKGMELQTLKSGHEVMVDPIAAIKAITELNKLDGHYAPQKFEYRVEFSEETE